ncbi:MAG: STAS domain-containing protein [Candidatus Latescibacteria bacterium]|nr:STAS domain-containing protein [Candidatus Latescibacterota bacterium]
MPDNIELQVNQENGIGILTIQGYINNLGGEKVAAACHELIGDDISNFLFDLSGCRLVNSIGISILIEVLEEAEAKGGRVGFCCVTPTIARTFRIMGLLQEATLYETRAEGLKALQV